MKEQRRAIIMGATSGIGLEVAKVLAGKGWLVGIAGRRQELHPSLAVGQNADRIIELVFQRVCDGGYDA